MAILQDIWNNFLEIAKEEVGSRIVETWLKAVTLLSWDAQDKILIIQAPNSFVKDWIQSKYMNLFQIHLGRLLHVTDFKLHFRAAQVNDVIPPRDTNLITPAYLVPKIIPGRVKNAISYKTTKNYGRLNSNYTFDTFIVGPHNSLATAAAHAIAQDPGNHYNPFLIYGGSGLGKTHLLHAIGNEIQRKNNKAVVFYHTTDQFVNEFISAIRLNKAYLFQQKYHSVDVLLIDDIQFISNKEQTQEAFFHIFNMLYDGKKQIVFSSDVFPRNIMGVEERLRSRLEWGLVADIQKPPLETQIAILRKKAGNYNDMISDEIAELIVQECFSNVRELEGALVRVMAFSSLTKQPISCDLVRKVFENSGRSYKKNEPVLNCHMITNIVCKRYSYTLDDLRSNSRVKDISLVRQIAMYLMKKLTDKSLKEIGLFLGRKDHSTVLHAFDKITHALTLDASLRDVIGQIEREVIQR